MDKKTHIHGMHISILNGETNYKELLSEEQIKILNNNIILQKIIKKFNYNE